jgi:PKD repeat protein
MAADTNNQNIALQRLKRSGSFSRVHMLSFMVIFGIIGSFILYKTFAAAPLVASVEAEQMILPGGSSVVADTGASAGKAVKMLANGTLTGSVNFPSSVNSLTINARGDQCSGAPTLTAAVDGVNTLVNTAVSNTSWSSFTFTPVPTYNSGPHTLSISFTNSLTKTKGSPKTRCTRNLYVDVANFYGPTPPPIPAPTVTLSSSPVSLTAGQASTLTWSSTNADSCSASGAWSGAQPTSGSLNTGALNQNATYNLSCTGTGGSASASATVTVSANTGTAVKASFSASPTSGSAPLGVNFKDTSTGSPATWLWNFGDGSTSTLQNPTHQYASAGTYSITLTASNATSTNTTSMSDLVNVTATSGVVDQMITPEGATIQIYSGVTGGWTAQKIYDLLKPNAYQLSVIGPYLTVKVQTQYASSNSAGASSSSNCSYYGFNSTIYLNASDGTSFSATPDGILAHEYGHAWTIYNKYMKHCGSWNDYLSERSLLGDSRVDSSYMWSPAEMAAEDYRQLFGTSSAINGMTQMNYQIPPASSITGFKSWFTNSWGTP